MTIKAADAKATAVIIKGKIAILEEKISNMSGSENPQVKELVKTAQIQKDTMQSVLDSMHGNHVSLKI